MQICAGNNDSFGVQVSIVTSQYRPLNFLMYRRVRCNGFSAVSSGRLALISRLSDFILHRCVSMAAFTLLIQFCSDVLAWQYANTEKMLVYITNTTGQWCLDGILT